MATSSTTFDIPAIGSEAVQKPLTPGQLIWRRFRRHRMAVIGMISFSILLLFVIGGSFFVSEEHANAISLTERLSPPSEKYWRGTDSTGRDIFSRVIWGSRVSLQISFLTVVLANLGGIILGVFGGYFGGLRDNIVMRLMDVMFSFPFILLAILIIAITGPGIFNVIISLAVAYLPYSARITHAGPCRSTSP